MDGILLINKPSGWTSFDVVAKIRGVIKRETGLKKPKVGHTGTLDPLATGLLVLTIGSYCKRAQEFSGLDKTYEVTMRLGLTSTTGDEEGEKTVVSDHVPSHEEVEDVIKEFIGEIQQTPPIYSAIKVDGQRAYKLARAGKEVILQPRAVRIDRIELVEYAYPEIKFIADVSSGTYVRSLVQDIGEKLEAGAYMTDLRRTRVGDFLLENAIKVEEFDASTGPKALLKPTDTAT